MRQAPTGRDCVSDKSKSNDKNKREGGCSISYRELLQSVKVLHCRDLIVLGCTPGQVIAMFNAL